MPINNNPPGYTPIMIKYAVKDRINELRKERRLRGVNSTIEAVLKEYDELRRENIELKKRLSI